MAITAADRRPGVAEIEAAALKAWPAHETMRDGSWVLRASGGYSKRANSLQCLSPDDDADAVSRLDAAARWFMARSLSPVVRVTPLVPLPLVAALDAGRWRTFEPTRVMLADLAETDAEPDEAVSVSAPSAPEWLQSQQQLQGYDEGRLGCLRGIVGQMAPPAFGLVLRSADGAPLASAYIACADGIGFLGAVVTAPEARRKGHARRVVSTGLALARRAGARFSVLQVLAANAAARGLYESLGYGSCYDYDHRRPAA